MLYGMVLAMSSSSCSLIRSEQQHYSPAGAIDRQGMLDQDGASRRRRDLVFVVNPRGANGATGREWKKLLPQLKARLSDQYNIYESITSGPLHAVDITREAIKEGVEAVVAVGGDGTLHEVINGFFEAGKPLLAQESWHKTSLGVIPLGTGSDFARTFGWKNNHHEAIDRIAKGKKTKIDIGVINGENGQPHYFINVADVHLSAKAGFYSSKYKIFGNLCYVLGALRAYVGHRNQALKVKVNGGNWEIFDKVTAICIGNAKYFGGGMKITPNADPCSGEFEVVILQGFEWYDFVFKLHKLYSGTHLSEKNVWARSVRSIEIEEKVHSDSIYVQSDGEHLGFLPRKFLILPGAVEMFS